jgi:hypothetical protein
MSELYGKGARELQERFGTERLADRIEERLVKGTIEAEQRAFIEARNMFFLATVDARGHASCSYKGGAPGFVRVLDERTIAFPSQDGNGMYVSLGAIAETGEVALLFIDFEGQERLRLRGKATIDPGDPLLAEYHEAQAVVRVAVLEVYPNCPRYIHRMTLVEPSRFVPKAACETPVPTWKRAEWAKDVIPDGDPARDPDRKAERR